MVTKQIKAAAYEPRPRRGKASITQQHWRATFLETVRESAPEVLQSLNQEPMRFFRLAGSGTSAKLLTWANLASENWHRVQDASFVLFRRKLWDWGEQWGLDAEWCLEAAFNALFDWTLDPESASELRWSASIHFTRWGPALVIPGEDRFSFEHSGWLVMNAQRKDFEKEVKKAFESTLKAYCDRIEEAASSLNYTQPPNKNELEHFKWLAYYQVKKMEYDEIKTHAPMVGTVQGISKAIKQIANVIDMELRPSARGRGRPSNAR